MGKYTTEQKQKALEMLSDGATHDEVSLKTGVEKKHLIVWKSRQKNGSGKVKMLQKLEFVKIEKTQLDDLKQQLSDTQFVYENHVDTLEKELEYNRERLRVALESKTLKISSILEKYSLPLAILLLHISAIFGVSHVMEMLLHSKIMALLTGVVVCSSGLVIFASKKSNSNLAMITIFSVFLIEVVCNLITIQSVMNIETYNSITKIGCNPYYVFFTLSLLLPALNLKLEVIMFDED